MLVREHRRIAFGDDRNRSVVPLKPLAHLLAMAQLHSRLPFDLGRRDVTCQHSRHRLDRRS